MIAKIIVSTALMLTTFTLVDGCDKHTPQPSETSTVLRTSIGDGSWIAGDEIATGIWVPEGDIENMTDCVWFTTPSVDGVSKEPTQSFTEGGKQVQVKLTQGMGFTTYKCGTWYVR